MESSLLRYGCGAFQQLGQPLAGIDCVRAIRPRQSNEDVLVERPARRFDGFYLAVPLAFRRTLGVVEYDQQTSGEEQARKSAGLANNHRSMSHVHWH